MGGGTRARGTVSAALVAALVAAAMLAALAGSASTACGSGSPGAVGATPGKVAPPFSGVTLDGDIVTLDEYKGKPLFLVYMTSG